MKISKLLDELEAALPELRKAAGAESEDEGDEEGLDALFGEEGEEEPAEEDEGAPMPFGDEEDEDMPPPPKKKGKKAPPMFG